VDILKGFFSYRKRIRAYGIQGSQWICGSFTEDCEKQRGRYPGDIDIINLFWDNTIPSPGMPLHPEFRAFINAAENEEIYRCHAFTMSVVIPSPGPHRFANLDIAAYWLGFFGHTRPGIHDFPMWKGMVEISLGSDTEDDAAVIHLSNGGAK
jgi:hypothetical protein